MPWSTVALVLALASALPARAEPPLRRRLAADLFGETVGEVRLTLDRRGDLEILTYRSDLRVVRDRVRLRQKAFIEAAFRADGALVRSLARRCSSPEQGDAPPTCGDWHRLDGAQAKGAAPALAAELLLARARDGEQCLDLIDEETGATGRACATVKRDRSGVELVGNKFGAPFRARIHGGLPQLFEAPEQGARFVEALGAVELSDADLFADPIEASGDADGALRRGKLRLWITGEPAAIARLAQVKGPGQRLVESREGSALVEVTRVAIPKAKRSRQQIDAAALLVAEARGRHVDCQAATTWFLERARARRWKVRPAVGFAWVDGRFAFHSWAIVETPDGARVPVDPLLAQVPADAGHVQLVDVGTSAGAVLVAFRRGLSLVVE